MVLTTGTRLGAYEIVAPLGEGGMGEVYRATDTALGRSVAIKVLPDAFASDPERLARFEREARTLAALNHPNIAQIYGLERGEASTGPGPAVVRALVMELVEGPTLAERIAQGPLPVDEALPIATQIAEALEAAHERGIVHRDLKPANVKVRDDGTVKVLDFGLAKAMEGPPGGGHDLQNLSQSPTIATPTRLRHGYGEAGTQMGVILGTVPYMSPEQAKGRPTDKRSDVWAFGCVLYEMLTGRRAFGPSSSGSPRASSRGDGEDVSETMASVLKSEPDWSLLPDDVPLAVATLIRRCLAKDRRERVSDISAAAFVVRELGGDRTPRRGSTPPQRADASRARAIAVTSILTALLAGTAAWALRPSAAPPTIVEFAITPAGRRLPDAVAQVVAISPDGTRVAYIADGRIFIRSLGDLEPRGVTDREAANPNDLMFAPDGESLAFFTVSSGGMELKRIPIGGGAATTLATLEGVPNFSGVTWTQEGFLVGVTGDRRGILRIPSNGGTPERIVSVDANEMAHGPQLLSDGHTVMFTLAKGRDEARWDRAQIVAQSLRDGTRRVLVEGGADGRYVKSGHLLYARGGTIYARRFDSATLTLSGPAVPVIPGVRRVTGGVSGTALFAVSDNGTLVYVPGPPATALNLVLGDGKRDIVPLKAPPASYLHPRVSPDGRFLAVGRNDGASSDIMTYDLSGSVEIKRLTFDGVSRFPVWFADSRRVTFQSAREGDLAIWWQAADGSSGERMTTAAKDEEHVPESWSRDGAHLLFSIRKASMYSLWVLRRAERTVAPFGQVQSVDPLSASFSPDGRWVAYALTKEGGGVLSPNRGVFVEPFPPTGEKHQAPKLLLDYHPAWAPDGRRLFYVPGANRPLVAVPIATLPSVTFGSPVELPDAPMPGRLSIDVRGYDIVPPDGSFISVSPTAERQSPTPSDEIRVTVNWLEELERLVPRSR